MPGFFVSDQQTNFQLHNRYPQRCLKEAMDCSSGTVKRHTLNKFLADKAFAETDELIVVLEGYLLNKIALFEQYGAQTVTELVHTMYRTRGETFFADFRGAFSGALFDKAKQKWLIYTNHTGDKAVFYAQKDGSFAAGSQVGYVLDACRELGWPLTFNEQAAYQMLTFGFMESDGTYACEIKRLLGGTYLCIEKGTVEVRRYFRLEKHPERFSGCSEAEIINALDAEFRRAVDAEYRKDEEYGLKHLADISGGLDSRMNTWVAHETKPRHLQLITYSKNNYLDERIAKEIATHWNDELLFKQLDDVSYLYEVDELTALNAGLSLYCGITGGKRMLEDLDMESYGLEHTGQLGDVLIGSYICTQNGLQTRSPSGKYSDKLSHRLSDKYAATFCDHELYLLSSRGFQGILNTHQVRDNYTEVTSPFLNAEFLQLCMNIPLELRMNHSIYKKWILTKYPNAAKYRWEKTGAKISEGRLIGILRKVVTKGPHKLLRMLGYGALSTHSMNPLDYWFAQNSSLKNYLDSYEADGYRWLPPVSEQLISDMKQLYATGTFNEKAMVLTVLAAAKLYFGESNEHEKH